MFQDFKWDVNLSRLDLHSRSLLDTAQIGVGYDYFMDCMNLGVKNFIFHFIVELKN